MDSGETMHAWARDLFPICRSLTGDGVRETLRFMQERVPELKIHEIPSATKVFDWTIPDEWNISDAFVADAQGNRLIDFRENNLHVVGYSEPVDMTMTREELEGHLHSLPDQPTAIPYVTSYYRRTWGFCLSQEQRTRLGDGPFHVRIDSTLAPGCLTYADAILPGASKDEVLLSTYVCHPSMANNELSGPVVAMALARWLASLPERRYTYRFVVAPETIGAIAYMSLHLDHLKEFVRAGWVLTCVGDERTFSYVPSRNGNTLADRVSQRVLKDQVGDYVAYSFLDRGSDERQWCSPGADLPVCSVMRSKYWEYPEYHTSLDDLTLVTPAGLEGAATVLRDCIEVLEANDRWRSVMPGEPQLGRRDLYPTTSIKGSTASVRPMMDVLTYCDGTNDLIALSEITGLPIRTVQELVAKLEAAEVIERVANA